MNLAQTLAASWQRRTPLIGLLLPFSWLFALLAAIRRLAYRRNWLATGRLPVPVIVVGNIVAGGSGKTPLVLWLVERLRGQGYHPGVVSRGHGGRLGGIHEVTPRSLATEVGDEPALLARRGGCPVFVGRDRLAAGRALLRAYPGCDLIVADDGLQHYALARDVEVAVIDRRGLGNGHLLPAGPLREPACRLLEVDARVLNEAVMPVDAGPAFAMRLIPHECEALCGGRRQPLSAFSGKRVHAVAGIGEPARFFDMLKAQGLLPVCHDFPDHHAFVPDEFIFSEKLPILMTEKDAVKCAALSLPDAWMVPVSAEIDPALLDFLLEKINGSKTA